MHHLNGLKFKSLQSSLFFIHHHGYKRTAQVQACDITSMSKQAREESCSRTTKDYGRKARREGRKRQRERVIVKMMNQTFSWED